MNLLSSSPGWFPVAVQALVVIAGSEGLCSSNTMAQDLKTHAVFVRRILAQLVRTNVVQAREGRDGGYRLARSAEDITLADVYQAVKVAEPQDDAVYYKGINAHVQTILDEVGTEAEQYLIEVLKQHTLATVLERMTIV